MAPARLTALLVVAMLAPAAASPKDEAKEHIARATQLHKEGKFDEAREELEAANALDPKPELLYALGQVHVKLGRCDEAIGFYELFLATRPKRGQAAAARQAIGVCKTKPPAAVDEPKPTPEVEPDRPPADEPKPDKRPTVDRDDDTSTETFSENRSVDAPADTPTTARQPWYRDKLGLGLAGAGVVAGVVAAVLYRAARGDIDAVAGAPTYEQGQELADGASRKRTYAAILGAGGAVLLGAGLVHILMFDGGERSVGVAPASSGIAITWSGRF